MNASFEEKSVWITLSGLLVVFSGYFFVAGNMLAAGVTETVVPFIPVFGVVTVLLVLLLAGGHAAAAITGRPEERDERDRMIECRAESHSSWILGVGVLGAVFAMAAPIGLAWIANGLLMALFLSEVLKHGLQIYYYRGGI